MNILLVEDDPQDADRIRGALQKSSPHFQLDDVATLAEALTRLTPNPDKQPPVPTYDLVLTDLHLPDGDGLVLLAHIRQQSLPLAVVILTGQGDEETAVTALKAGADDYVVKRGDYLQRLPLVLEEAVNGRRALTVYRARQLRVLYVEHSLPDIVLTRRHLAQHAPHLRLEVVHTGPELLQRLSEPPPPGEHTTYDLLLLDYRLPGLSALELLKEIREVRRLDLPVVLITEQGDEALAVQALKLGAADYLVKNPGYLFRLPAALENAFHTAQVTRQQAALRKSEERYRRIVETAQEGIWVIDADDNTTFVNARMVELLGYTVEEMLGQPIWAFMEEEDRASAAAFLERRRQGIAEQHDFKYRRKDGTTLWTLRSTNPLYDEQGHYTGALAMITDITERKRAEEELRRRNRELAVLNRVIAASAAMPSPELVSVLETACRELARAFDVPQAAAALLNEEKTEASVVAEYLAEGRPSALNYSIPVAGNPSFQYLLSRKAPLIVADAQHDPRLAPLHEALVERGTVSLLLLPLIIEGEVVGSLGLDAIEPRPLSTEEVNLAWSVADQVAGVLARARLSEERRRLEEQYHQAQKMEAIGQLTAGIAHDFNNLLTAINGFAGLLQREFPQGAPQQEMIGKILHSGRRATDLVRQLLTFSRKQIIEPQVLNLNTVAVELDRMLRRIIGENIELETIPGPNLWPIKMDPAQLEQVIVNLVVNARDAMLEGGRLTIETANVELDEGYTANHLESQRGEHVLLAVSDTGTGMSETVKAHLFEPFFTTKEIGQGTGLGLATVYGIVKQGGGNIWVYSEEGAGTTFKIYLPRAEAGTPSPARPEARLKMPSGSETILLVEDDQGVREFARRVLRTQGYALVEAWNGLEAVRLAADHDDPIHLLLTDVVMPGMSGKALAEALTQTYPNLKVLFMSGYTDSAIERHGVLDPGVALLQKPFNAMALASKVRQVLDA